MDLYGFIWIYGKFMAFSEALHRFHDPPRLLPVAPEVRLSLQRAMFHAGGTPPSPRSHGNAGKVAQKHQKWGHMGHVHHVSPTKYGDFMGKYVL